MTLEVMIVDDEPAGRRILRESCAREPGLRVVGEFGDGRAALEAIRAHPPDILFLDIRMDSLDGLSLARALDPRTLPYIVFVTGYDCRAGGAFEPGAADHLLKPFDESRFRSVVARVRRRRQAETAAERQTMLAALIERIGCAVAGRGARPRVLVESGGRMQLLDAARIELAEADRDYVRVTVGQQTFRACGTVQQAEKTLQSQPMLRISRSSMINLEHLRAVSRTGRGDFTLVLSGGATVTSGEGYREAVRDRLSRLRLGAGGGGA